MARNVDAFLAHHGVKGMKWGVRKEYEPSERKSGSKSPTVSGSKPSAKQAASAEKALREYAKSQGVDSELLRLKYGPDEPEAPKENFYQRHKTAIHVGAGLAVAGLAVYGGYQLNEKLKFDALEKAKNFELDEIARKESARKQEAYDAQARIDAGREHVRNLLLGDYQEKILKKGNALRLDAIFGSFDQNKLDDTPLTLPRGHILSRVSTAEESEIRPDGFYATHSASDLKRYKSILPIYWKQWGYDADSGYVVNLKAKSEIKAPSRREAYRIYEKLLKEDPAVREKTFGLDTNLSASELANRSYLSMSSNLAVRDNELTKTYIAAVKKAGYNALIDENDAGTLGSQPLRTLDGSMFSIDSTTPLSADEISKHQSIEFKRIERSQK